MRQNQYRLDSTPRDAACRFARVAPAILLSLSQKLREGQRVFAATGGLHGAAIFSLDGTMLRDIREDVGRHNAVDKVIGFALTNAMVRWRNI